MTGMEDFLGRLDDDGGIDPEVVRNRILGQNMAELKIEVAQTLGPVAVELVNPADEMISEGGPVFPEA